MSLILYNSLTRRKEEFVPLSPGRALVYVCGPTVYNRPHIGNARPAVIFDVMVRLLREHYKVTYVRNITDIDDKINNAAAELDEDISTVAARHTAHYHLDMEALGVLPPDIEPYATHHVQDMIDMILLLINKGHAYQSEGHVLFRVNSFQDYGKLSGREIENLLDGARVEVAGYKEEPGDFVLWKPSSGSQPGWDSPWGRGRPGWHIECSAMAYKHLGQTIDIHGGGNDLIFPHHENEIAQSVCAHDGVEFSKYWLHNGFVNIDYSKMSKSVGNVVLVNDLLKEAPGEVVRVALLSAHYRHPLDWNENVLIQARKKLDRLYNALSGVSGWEDNWRDCEPNDEVVNALNDDLNTPRALAALFDIARAINRHNDVDEKVKLARILRSSAELIGLLSSDPTHWIENQVNPNLSEEVQLLIDKRNIARDQQDFVLADRIRDELEEHGVIIEDGPNGVRWRFQND
ncbi:MAG: cysteine--tRNA ligase [Pseudomonadota bacterium]|nr:cysteine--tRNA ligase [Pseudomonadota bacterium]